jgi:hypothetical protein
MEVVKVRQPLHRQAVLVLFALDVLFHQMLGKPFTSPLDLIPLPKRLESEIWRQLRGWSTELFSDREV